MRYEPQPAPLRPGRRRAGTFTGGARCYVTQSTLYTGIAHLEKELGERLCVRTTRYVNLTAEHREQMARASSAFCLVVCDGPLRMLEAAASLSTPDA